MGKSTPTIPNPATAAAAGIQADIQNQPFSYLINAASTLGKPVTIGGKTFDFTGLGSQDVAGQISDQMAQTLLDLQTETSPTIIQQRLDELKAADPQGYAARKQLFDKIISDSKATPDRPLNKDLQDQLQTELAKGVGFDDAKQLEQAHEAARGGQVGRGIYLGNAPAAEEARQVTAAGENLRNTRQQNALNLISSQQDPEAKAFADFQRNLGNLGSFVAGQAPAAQFRQVSAASQGPVSLTGGSPATNTFNPNAAGAGLNNALGIYQGQVNWANSSANPWLAGLSIGATGLGSVAKQQPGWFNGSGGSNDLYLQGQP